VSGCTDRGCPNPVGIECHCAACHRTFGNLSLFDAHQDVDYSRTPAVVCLDPATMRVSLGGSASPGGDVPVQDDRGVWHTPAGLGRRQRNVAQLAAARERRPR
jgi:hypothetical protein